MIKNSAAQTLGFRVKRTDDEDDDNDDDDDKNEDNDSDEDDDNDEDDEVLTMIKNDETRK